MDTEQELIEYLDGKMVYLYGAGIYAGRLLSRLRQKKVTVQGILVTDLRNNPSDLSGVKVQAAENVAKENADIAELTVIVALAKGHLEVMDYLLNLGFQKIVVPGHKIWQEINENELGRQEAAEKKADVREIQETYQLDFDYPALEPKHCAVVETRTGQALFRAPLYVDVDVQAALKKECTREAFEALYGDFCKVPFAQGGYLSEELAKRERIELYAVTSHADKQKRIDLRRNGVIPLQVGAALSDVRMGYATDDTGDNISIENSNYCECTGLYWIWKNTGGQNYVGLSHYRRRFRWDEESVCYMVKKDLDAVIILPQFSPEGIEKYFSRFICKHDWQFMKEAVTKYDIAYDGIFERYEHSHFFIPCNMAVFKRAWFDCYCEFAFTVAEEVDKRYKKMQVVRQDRYIGYLFENLLSLFLIRHHSDMRIAYADMEFLR